MKLFHMIVVLSDHEVKVKVKPGKLSGLCKRADFSVHH